MPLIKSKSKKAFEHNLKAELAAGKPKDQALAIAYSTQRHAGKKMAEGGEVKKSEPNSKLKEAFKSIRESFGEKQPVKLLKKKSSMMGVRMAEGGEIEDEMGEMFDLHEMMESPEHEEAESAEFEAGEHEEMKSVAEAIRRKKRQKKA